ncbi:hypothetical protein J1614_011139 [Plenodomus biglobosus]|nr:hypothetical protein J1614_011139 [Plenodomus biglobosus]
MIQVDHSYVIEWPTKDKMHNERYGIQTMNKKYGVVSHGSECTDIVTDIDGRFSVSTCQHQYDQNIVPQLDIRDEIM